MAPNLAQNKTYLSRKVSSLSPWCQALLEPSARDQGDKTAEPDHVHCPADRWQLVAGERGRRNDGE